MEFGGVDSIMPPPSYAWVWLNICITAPVVVSTSAVASRTSTPVILWISCRSDWQELPNSCQ